MRFGRDSRYWRSRLKAMGVAWACSTWLEIGPVSEASLGNIQSRRPQQGFVDHVVTPMVGTEPQFLERPALQVPLVSRFPRRNPASSLPGPPRDGTRSEACVSQCRPH